MESQELVCQVGRTTFSYFKRIAHVGDVVLDALYLCGSWVKTDLGSSFSPTVIVVKTYFTHTHTHTPLACP